jgi:hypothetical protein
MVRSLTLALVILSAASLFAAQAPAQDRPPADNPAVQKPAVPTTPAPTPPSAEQPSPQRPAQSATPMSKVTYIGCVKPGTGADTWVLESAELAPSPTSGKESASAQTPSPSAVATAGGKLTFNLDPAATVNLKSHANHKVELVGTVSPAKSSPSSAAPSTTPADRQQFRVESLKMVSATCP